MMGVPEFPPKPSEWLPAEPPAPPIPRWLYRNVKGAVPFEKRPRETRYGGKFTDEAEGGAVV